MTVTLSDTPTQIPRSKSVGLCAEFRILLSDTPIVLSVSDSINELLGFTAEDFICGKVSLTERIHLEDGDLASRLFFSWDSPASGSFPIRLRQASGKIRIVRLDYKRISSDEAGERLHLVLSDAKGLYRIEQAIADVNFKSMMDNAEDFIFFKNQYHVITGANQKLASICTSVQHWSELIGQTDYDVFAEACADKFYRLEKQVYSGMPFVTEDQEYIKANGASGWISNCKYSIRNEDGEIIGLFGIARDITERKKIEDELRKSEARLMLAQRIAHVGNWELDLVSNKLWWSDEIYRIFEVDSNNFGASYESFLAVVHPDDRDMVNSAYLNSLKSRAPYDIEHRLLLQDGRIKYVHERCETVYGSDGAPLCSVGTVQDISEWKRLKIEGADMLRRIESLILQIDDRTVAPQENATARSADAACNLSRRHLDVIELIAAGLTSAQIAVRLNISPTTVITHRRNLMRRLGLHSTAELTAYAIKNKIVSC